MRNILILAISAITFVATLPLSTVASATTPGACNAGFQGCTAKCGNSAQALGVGREGGLLRPTQAQQSCFASCRSTLSACNAPNARYGGKRIKK